MTKPTLDLLSIEKGAVTAPAGCGKTHLISEALKQHTASKPILLLTHTNAGVAALRGRLDKADVPSSYYRLFTIDGWAIRLVSTFPQRSKIAPETLFLTNPKKDYPEIREATICLLKARHIEDIIKASYSRIIVDEYQDCSIRQHRIIAHAAKTLPTCILGDPLQAIFGFNGADPLAKWKDEVCSCFPVIGELDIPWRWKKENKENFGKWLLDIRSKLEQKQPINLSTRPTEVSWCKLDKGDDVKNQLRAVKSISLGPNERILIIGDSKNPSSQRKFASKIPEAIVIESVDLKDFVQFTKRMNFNSSDALKELVDFASNLMTNVGGADLIKKVRSLQNGTARKTASRVESSACDFVESPNPNTARSLLSEISRQGGVRLYRQEVLRTCIKALEQCNSDGSDFYDIAIKIRDQNRLIGRPLAKKSVGSTLLLKGLEAEVCVILNADELDANNLYVAMTRGSKKLVICSENQVLNP